MLLLQLSTFATVDKQHLTTICHARQTPAVIILIWQCKNVS